MRKLWTINKLPKTQNQRLKMCWQARDRETKDWRLRVRAICGKPPPKVEGKCRVTITMYRKKLQDPDNAVGSVKPVLDAMVTRKGRPGWLVDDSAEFLELHVREEKSKDQRTVIEWEVI